MSSFASRLPIPADDDADTSGNNDDYEEDYGYRYGRSIDDLIGNVLRDGRSAVRRLSEEEILASGESPANWRNPNYVPAAALLEGFDRFDAEVFGF